MHNLYQDVICKLLSAEPEEASFISQRQLISEVGFICANTGLCVRKCVDTLR